MSKMFNPGEVVQFAVQIETNGELFYRAFSRKLKDRVVSRLFTHLANEEVKHRVIYEAMLSELAEYTPHETYPDEYYLYLRAYVDNIIFSPVKQARLVRDIKGVAGALDFAIQRELESILYYTEIKNFVSPDQQVLVNRIIAEERKHYWRLSDQKRRLR
jgi:rubrerythrin